METVTVSTLIRPIYPIILYPVLYYRVVINFPLKCYCPVTCNRKISKLQPTRYTVLYILYIYLVK